MAEPQQADDNLRIARVVDFRIPLWGLLTGGGAVLWALVNMYFTLNQLVKDVNDMQINVKAGSSQVTTVAGEIAILRFRVENLEAEKRAAAAQQEYQPAPQRRVKP